MGVEGVVCEKNRQSRGRGIGGGSSCQASDGCRKARTGSRSAPARGLLPPLLRPLVTKCIAQATGRACMPPQDRLVYGRTRPDSSPCREHLCGCAGPQRLATPSCQPGPVPGAGPGHSPGHDHSCPRSRWLQCPGCGRPARSDPPGQGRRHRHPSPGSPRRTGSTPARVLGASNTRQRCQAGSQPCPAWRQAATRVGTATRPKTLGQRGCRVWQFQQRSVLGRQTQH